MKKLEFDVDGVSDIGTTKKVNQDKYVYKVYEINGEEAGVFAVADGVGGLESGEIASAMAVSGLLKWWESRFLEIYSDYQKIEKSLKVCFEEINKEIMVMSDKTGKKMGTTFTVMIVYKNKAIICHIGDSRIYRYKSKMVSSSIDIITKDHSKDIECQVDNMIIKRPMLTQCLGVNSKIECDTKCIDIHKRDKYIICSDGIYKTQDEKTIKKIISEQAKTMDVCCELINNAKRMGETDNITVISIEIKE